MRMLITLWLLLSSQTVMALEMSWAKRLPDRLQAEAEILSGCGIQGRVFRSRGAGASPEHYLLVNVLPGRIHRRLCPWIFLHDEEFYRQIRRIFLEGGTVILEFNRQGPPALTREAEHEFHKALQKLEPSLSEAVLIIKPQANLYSASREFQYYQDQVSGTELRMWEQLAELGFKEALSVHTVLFISELRAAASELWAIATYGEHRPSEYILSSEGDVTTVTESGALKRYRDELKNNVRSDFTEMFARPYAQLLIEAEETLGLKAKAALEKVIVAHVTPEDLQQLGITALFPGLTAGCAPQLQPRRPN